MYYNMSSKKQKKSSFQCKFCEVCLTNGGLKKHVTKKHSSSKVQESSSSDCLKRFLREKCLQISSRWLLPWWYPASRAQWVKETYASLKHEYGSKI